MIFELIAIAIAVLGAVMLLLDYLQTRTIAKNPHRWRETNPWLGEHPELEDVNTWFGGWAAVYVVVSFVFYIAGNFWALAGLGAGAALLEGWYVFNNFRKGIKP